MRDSESQRTMSRRRVKHLHWALLIGLSVVIFISVILTGVFFSNQDVKNNARHSLDQSNGDNLSPIFNNATVNTIDSGLLGQVDLIGFDPNNGLTYSMTFQQFVAADDDAPLACVFSADDSIDAAIPFLTINPLTTQNDGQNKSIGLNLSTNGFLTRYPFDVYTGQLAVFMSVSNFVANTDTNSSCDPLVDTDVVPVAMQVQVGQSLSGFSATFTVEQDSDDARNLIITFNVHRDGITRFFAVIMFIITWVLVVAILVATGQVVLYHTEPRFELVGASAALLFALPQIRSASPGIPASATISDTVGYFWNIALLGISTTILIGHSVWQLRRERYEKRHEYLRTPVQGVYLPETGNDFGNRSFTEKRQPSL